MMTRVSSEGGICQVCVKMSINEWHNGRSEIGGIQGILGDCRERFPGNQRLRTPNSSCQATLVINWPDAVVSD